MTVPQDLWAGSGSDRSKGHGRRVGHCGASKVGRSRGQSCTAKKVAHRHGSRVSSPTNRWCRVEVRKSKQWDLSQCWPRTSTTIFRRPSVEWLDQGCARPSRSVSGDTESAVSEDMHGDRAQDHQSRVMKDLKNPLQATRSSVIRTRQRRNI